MSTSPADQDSARAFFILFIKLLEDGVTGIFVPPGDVRALREAIQYLWNNPEVAEKMGREGRQRAEKVFALPQFVANVHQVVDDVITGNHTPIPTIEERMWTLRKPTPQKPTREHLTVV